MGKFLKVLLKIVCATVILAIVGVVVSISREKRNS